MTAEDKDPKPQRPKMTLEQQQVYILDLLARCRLRAPEHDGKYAGTALLSLTTEDMLKLETIQQTLAVFELHGADKMIRDKLSRGRRK